VDKSAHNRTVIRPFSSKRGLASLLICSLVGLFFAGITVFVLIVAPGGDAEAGALVSIMGILSVITIVLGIILYLVFPRVRIVFDTSRKEAIIKRSRGADTAVPFDRLEPFQISEILRGYAHQYYCRNGSFGEYADLFFGASHRKILERGRKLAALTNRTLIDFDGTRVV
jgi:hypothetical protein